MSTVCTTSTFASSGTTLLHHRKWSSRHLFTILTSLSVVNWQSLLWCALGMEVTLFARVCSSLFYCCRFFELNLVKTDLFYLRFVLANPYLECESDIVNRGSAFLYKYDRKACFIRAQEWTRKHAAWCLDEGDEAYMAVKNVTKDLGWEEGGKSL